MENISVVIQKEHCMNASYSSNNDCPLARAFKQQYPEKKLDFVGGFAIHADEKYYHFNHSSETGWVESRMQDLLKGRIESYIVHANTIQEWLEC